MHLRRGADPADPANPAGPTGLARPTGPTGPTGLAVLTAAVCALVFAGLTAYVSIHAPTTGLDRHVQSFALGHRVSWLNALMETWTWLGSTVVLVPVLLVVSAYVGWSRRDPYVVACLWVAFGGSVLLYTAFKTLIGRARPPVSQMLVHTGGYAYPSGHSTQAVAVWGLLAVLAVAGLRRRAPRALVLGVAAIVIALIGASRIYLGVHWVTDVAGGYALGAAWLALLLATLRTLRRRAPRGGRG